MTIGEMETTIATLQARVRELETENRLWKEARAKRQDLDAELAAGRERLDAEHARLFAESQARVRELETALNVVLGWNRFAGVTMDEIRQYLDVPERSSDAEKALLTAVLKSRG